MARSLYVRRRTVIHPGIVRCCGESGSSAIVAISEVDLVRVVIDNLNTHKPASLYEAFEPEEARRIVKKLEFRYTPKHGSWLNMAEIELSVLQRQCLDRRIPNEEALKREITAWEQGRNKEKATIDWRFSVTDAREKLRRLYPSRPT